MKKRIYIMGPVGSGKTTLAKRLSIKYHIPLYELDKIVWDDEFHIKRTDDEIHQSFQKIIHKKAWIIEDVGRNKFQLGRDLADVIYYIRMSKIKAYYRVSKRWIRQRIGKEEYSYPPTMKQLCYFYSIVHSYYKKEKEKIQSLEKVQGKVVYLTTKIMNKL